VKLLWVMVCRVRVIEIRPLLASAVPKAHGTVKNHIVLCLSAP